MIQYKNLSENKAFSKLKESIPVDLRESLTKQRVSKFKIESSSLYSFYFSGISIQEKDLETFQALAEESQLIDKYKALLRGEIINTGEKRKVLHHLTRGELEGKVEYEGENIREFYEEEQKRTFAFAQDVFKGNIKGSTGKVFKNVVQIGIGGSDLGPRAIYLSLKEYARLSEEEKLKAYFISNVDPDDAYGVLADLNLEETLFIIVSKSGTTQETLTNELLVRSLLKEKGLEASKHFIAVTSKTSPLANNPHYLISFYMNDFVGGRYSSTSAVGTTVLTLSLGEKIVKEFLEGAHQTDKEALNYSIWKNPPLLDALLGIYQRNIMNLPSQAVLPYSQGLSRFAAHLQQLDMESNGKSVNRENKPINYETGPLIFGEPGTNGQHSFYQLLHQGTDIIPLEFIGFKENQMYPNKDSQDKLKANLIAQMIAFAKGHENKENPNKNFKGNRPNSLLLADKLTPKVMGALLSHFENKVMFQGFLWNINSFDQEGVQLGKILTNKVLDKDPQRDEALKAFEEIVGL